MRIRPKVVLHPGGRPPALEVLVEVDADDLVWGQETVVDPLLEGIGVDGVAEVRERRNVARLLRRRRQSEVDRGVEVVEHLAPRARLPRAPSVALVDHDQSEEDLRELLVDVLVILGPRDRLIEGEVDLVGRVRHAVADLSHHLSEGLEVVGDGLVGEDVAIDEEEDALDPLRFPQPPDDLKGRVGLAGARRHDEQRAPISARYGLDGRLDGVALVVARFLASVVVVERMAGKRVGLVGQALVGAVAVPEVVRGGELIEADLSLNGVRVARAVVEDEAGPVAREDERDVEGLGVVEGLLHPAADRLVRTLGLDDREGKVGLVGQQVVRALPGAALGRLAANRDPACRERVLAPDLCRRVPPSPDNGRRDELIADVRL